MERETPLIEGELYHIYNRGAHKNTVFTSADDYSRFMLLMYLANGTSALNIANQIRKGRSFSDMFDGTIDKSLVDVHAYCLMPNHFHMVLRQKAENGITSYLKKVLTGYSMYFNAKHEHSGVLFQGRFKSRHIGSDAYFRWIYSYVHLNPVGLVQSDWEECGVRDPERVRRFMNGYQYSSYQDYCVKKRVPSIVLADEAPSFLRETNDLKEMLTAYEKDGPFQDTET